MNKERLEEAKKCLVNVIENDKKWDMSTFIDSEDMSAEMRIENGGALPDIHYSITSEFPQSREFCNTACCALGHMALWEPFNKKGLYVDQFFNVCYKIDNKTEVEDTIAGRIFFSLSENQSYYLFDPKEYTPNPVEYKDITPQDVICRIDDVLRGDIK